MSFIKRTTKLYKNGQKLLFLESINIAWSLVI